MQPPPLLFALSLFAWSCSGPTGPDSEFNLGAGSAFVTGPTLDFVHNSGFTGKYYFPETFGSGLALFDSNEDGQLDLYAVQGGPVPGSNEALGTNLSLPTNALMLGLGDGRFRDATMQAGAAADSGFGMGVCSGDVNGDGRLDLAVSNVGKDRIFIATGDQNSLFKDATPASLASPDLPNWSSSLGFADFDHDGHLDLVVLHYSRWKASDHENCVGPSGVDYCDVKMYPGARDNIYRGNGRGDFEDRSKEWNFGQKPARGLGVGLVDFDDDGFVDVFVANDTDANHYYHNEAGTGFSDMSALSGTSANMDGRLEAGMGVAVADVTGDGLADFIVTNFTSEPNSLYINRGKNRFRERSRSSGIAAASVPKLAFGVTWQDFNLDGLEDLFAACGHVQRHSEMRSAAWAWKQPDQLLLAAFEPDAATAKGAESKQSFAQRPIRFIELSPGPPFSEARVGRGLAAGDINGDGRADLLVSNSGDQLVVGINELAKRGAWLGVRLFQSSTSSRSNTAAIGAKLTLTLDNGRELTRWIRSGTGYLSQDDQGQLFGIPSGTTPVQLKVRWPDGAWQSFPPGALDTWMRVTRD